MKKSDYRKFVIRTVVGNDDFASMREVITRRYGRLKEENAKRPRAGAGGRRPGPVTRRRRRAGGAGHHRISRSLRSPNGKNGSTSTDRKTSRWFSTASRRCCTLVQMVRDEAHRFAVTFHRTRRNASRLRSELDQIPGVGEKTVAKLLRHFGSLERVRQAPEDELARVAGPAVARRVREGLTVLNTKDDCRCRHCSGGTARADISD